MSSPVTPIKGISIPAATNGRKAAKKVQSGYSVAGKVTGLARSIGGLVGQVRHLPRHTKLALKGTKLLTLPLLPLTVMDCIDDIKKLGSKAPAKEKIKKVFSLILNLESVTDSVAATFSILELAKVIGESAVQWIPVFNIVSYIIGFISLGLSGESTFSEAQLPKLLAKLEKDLQKIDARPGSVELKEQEKAQLLIDVLEKLKKDGIEPLRQRLLISKKADLPQRMSKLTELLKKEGAERQKAIEEARTVTKTLASRAKVTFGFKLAELINKIIAIVATGLLLFAPDPVSKLVGCVLLFVSAVFSLVLIGGKFFFISKNPFDPNSKSRAREFVDRISRAIETMIRRLKMRIDGLKSPSISRHSVVFDK
jgi:hypothetical protein